MRRRHGRRQYLNEVFPKIRRSVKSMSTVPERLEGILLINWFALDRAIEVVEGSDKKGNLDSNHGRMYYLEHKSRLL